MAVGGIGAVRLGTGGWDRETARKLRTPSPSYVAWKPPLRITVPGPTTAAAPYLVLDWFCFAYPPELYRKPKKQLTSFEAAQKGFFFFYSLKKISYNFRIHFIISPQS